MLLGVVRCNAFEIFNNAVHNVILRLHARFISHAAMQNYYKIGIPAMLSVLDLSRLTCFHLTGRNESWCSLAYKSQDRHRGWRLFVKVMGEKHCEKSYIHHNKPIEPDA
jgi:hypothetical protein